METFFSTCAQLVPVLLIVLAVDVGRRGLPWSQVKPVLIGTGALEIGALFGTVTYGIPRPDWIHPALPWVGTGAMLIGVSGLVVLTLLALARHRTGEEIDRIADEFAAETTRAVDRAQRKSARQREVWKIFD